MKKSKVTYINVLLNFFLKNCVLYLVVQHKAWSNRLPLVSRELSQRVNYVSEDPTKYI